MIRYKGAHHSCTRVWLGGWSGNAHWPAQHRRKHDHWRNLDPVTLQGPMVDPQCTMSVTRHRASRLCPFLTLEVQPPVCVLWSVGWRSYVLCVRRDVWKKLSGRHPTTRSPVSTSSSPRGRDRAVHIKILICVACRYGRLHDRYYRLHDRYSVIYAIYIGGGASAAWILMCTGS